MLVLLLVTSNFAAAQESWIYTPYKIQVWYAIENQPQFTPGFRGDLYREIGKQAWVVSGAAWRITQGEAPPQLRVEMQRNLERLTADQLLAADATLADMDKLFLVNLSVQANALVIATRELDVRSRLLGPILTTEVPQRELAVSEIFRMMTGAFAPLGRVDNVTGSEAIVRLRAGGLVVDENNPSLMKAGQSMMAVQRQNDRMGNPRPNGIRVVEWTLLEVNAINNGRATCTVHTANKAYLGGRASSRVERITLGLRLTEQDTTLELVSRDQLKKPLVGYEIYAKNPKTEDSELIGQTDWRGQITIPPAAEEGVRLLYVRSGGTLLARLPLVPGQATLARAEIPDDEKRLHAEALVRGMQATLIDVVAQRELLAARTRNHVKEGRLDEAQKLIDEFRTIPTLTDLTARLEQDRQSVTTDNSKQQDRIDKLFAETQELIVKFIDPTLVDRLAVELSNARNGTTSATPSSATAPPPADGSSSEAGQ